MDAWDRGPSPVGPRYRNRSPRRRTRSRPNTSGGYTGNPHRDTHPPLANAKARPHETAGVLALTSNFPAGRGTYIEPLFDLRSQPLVRDSVLAVASGASRRGWRDSRRALRGSQPSAVSPDERPSTGPKVMSRPWRSILRGWTDNV